MMWGMEPGASIPDGTAVIFDRVSDTWVVGVISTLGDARVANPMAEHLERDVLLRVDLDTAIPLESLQRALPEQEQREPFGPIVEMRAGTVLAQRTIEDSHRYRFFELAADVIHPPFAMPDFEQPLRVRQFEPRVGAVGELLDLPRGRNASVRSLATRAQIHYAVIPDRFLAVLEIPVITEWSVHRVRATGTFPTKSLSGPSDVTFREGRANATVTAAERGLFRDETLPVETSSVYAKMHDGTLRPDTPTVPQWIATGVRYTGASMGNGDAVFRFLVPELALTFSDGTASTTRETFRGLTIEGFSHRILPEYPDVLHVITAPNAYIVSLFGRDARIVQSAANHVSIVYEGCPLEREEIGIVLSLVEYMCGNRGEHMSTETFDATGRLTFRYQQRGHMTKRGTAPIRIDYWTTTPALVARDFDAMLARLRSLSEKSPPKIDAAFHHYFEGVASQYPVTRILMLAVAIDTLVALVMGNQRQVHILDNEAFQRVIKPARDATVAALASEGVPQDKTTKILNKLEGLNNASAAQRQRDFWTQVGVALTKEEADVLDTRHEVVHEGHVGSERTAEQLWDNYRRGCILANLFNRAMLTLLGWTGPYLDATDNRQKRELPLTHGTPPAGPGEST